MWVWHFRAQIFARRWVWQEIWESDIPFCWFLLLTEWRAVSARPASFLPHHLLLHTLTKKIFAFLESFRWDYLTSQTVATGAVALGTDLVIPVSRLSLNAHSCYSTSVMPARYTICLTTLWARLVTKCFFIAGITEGAGSSSRCRTNNWGWIEDENKSDLFL